MKSDLQIYLRLLGHARPYWKVMVIAVLAMICSAALEPVLPALMQPLIDKSLIQKNAASMWQIPLFIVLAFVLKGVADYVSNVASQTVAQKTMADLRALVFVHQLDLPLPRHQREEGGRMLSRVTYDTGLIGEAVSSAWVTILRDSLVLIGLLGFLFYTAWQLTLLVIMIAPALALAIRVINRKIRQSSQNVQTLMGRVTGLVQEGLHGLREIKIFGMQQQQADRFEDSNQSLRREQMRVIRVQAINVPLVQILAACSVAAVIFVASRLSKENLLTPGEFVAFITGMSMVFEPVRRLTNVNAVLQRGLVAARSIFDLLDEITERQSFPTPQGAPTTRREASPTAVKFHSAPPEIRFEQVSYQYPGQVSAGLQSFSAVVPGGTSAVIVGESGAGKTTLLYLLCGFDRPTSGEIYLQGRPLSEMDLSELRRLISYVGQAAVLFDLSVRENLLLARPDASDADLWGALAQASADGFVRELADGLDSKLGTLGDTLSGGQRQRLAIARAFLKDAPILLLDEPTSALDRDSEGAVLQGLYRLMQNRTTLMVSHSPERLHHVHQVIQL
jgi:ATP-binding cassette, subfamily B, bacterial MsbA